MRDRAALWGGSRRVSVRIPKLSFSPTNPSPLPSPSPCLPPSLYRCSRLTRTDKPDQNSGLMRAETTCTNGGAAETLLTSSHSPIEAAAVSGERGEEPEFIPHPRVSHPQKGAEMLWVVKQRSGAWWAACILVCFLTRFRHRTWNQNPKLSQLLLGAG